MERGRGYQPAEKREPETLPINAMLIDADFSPIERANFQVETIRAGRGAGSADPRAVDERQRHPRGRGGEASRILEDQFNLLTDFRCTRSRPRPRSAEVGTEPAIPRS